MKNLLWIITACFLFALPFAAQAQFPPTPKSRPNAAPQVTQAEIQAPAVQAPAQVAAPAVVVAAPTTLEDVRAWINTAFLGLLTTIGGWIGFRGIKNAGTATGGPPAIVGDLLSKLADPTVRQMLEAHGLQIALGAVQSGIPKSLIQGAIGLAPAGGTINATYDATVGPMIHNLGIKALQDMIAKQAS